MFFFQAEDGIRYHCVTGVQTCALPISLVASRSGHQRTATFPPRGENLMAFEIRFTMTCSTRSEERRVGKEGVEPAQPHGTQQKGADELDVGARRVMPGIHHHGGLRAED